MKKNGGNIMAKMITKNSKEIRKEWTPEKLAELEKKDIPSFSTGITEEDIATGRVKHLGRGFAAFKEHINRSGRPKVEDRKIVVSIRLPNTDVEKLRAMGKGWQTRVSNYLSQGIQNDKIASVKPGS
jgi:uncharacterized protein (DUF4415 family)